MRILHSVKRTKNCKTEKVGENINFFGLLNSLVQATNQKIAIDMDRKLLAADDNVRPNIQEKLWFGNNLNNIHSKFILSKRNFNPWSL